MSATIIASSVLCPVGRGFEQAWASVRTGLGRIGNSRVMDRRFRPIRMGLVPEDALAPLSAEAEKLPITQRGRRMLRLAAPALQAVAPMAGSSPLRMFLGLPELSASESPWIRSFALQLGKMAEVAIDAPNSRVVPGGRAAALAALELALDALARQPDRAVVVGGVDSFLDLRLLGELDAEQRLLGMESMEGFIPGEGAGFLVLASASEAATANRRSVLVHAAATAPDTGHRYGTEPARGEGLAAALEVLRARATDVSAPVGSTFAALNGEQFDSKLWGVARLRHTDFFASRMVMEHPADCMGDTGAASGAILAGLAATALLKGHRAGPALVWAASDREPRGCALLSTTPS